MAFVRAGLEAQGGEDALRAIHHVGWDLIGYRNELEESERPEGPYIAEFHTDTQIDDFAEHPFKETTEFAVYPAFRTTTGTVVANGIAMRLAGGRRAPGTADMIAYAREKLALSPERLLLSAVDASDLEALPDTSMQGVRHHVVCFNLDGAPVTVYLNGDTHLPTAWDYAGPLAHAGFWNFLGHVTQRTSWSFWWLAKGGVRLPLQWEIDGNGQLWTMWSVKRASIDGALAADAFEIPAEVRAATGPCAPAPISKTCRWETLSSP